jgi:hypothetical protein
MCVFFGAVFATYAWSSNISDDSSACRQVLLVENRSATAGAEHSETSAHIVEDKRAEDKVCEGLTNRIGFRFFVVLLGRVGAAAEHVTQWSKAYQAFQPKLARTSPTDFQKMSWTKVMRL